jgi:hypothetical protein
MRTSILRVLAVTSLIASFGPFHLTAQSPVRFKIPFDFTVESKSFAAGNYDVIELQSRFIHIRGDKGKTGMIIAAYPGEPSKVPGIAVMTFNRYGDQYFLSSVSEDNRGWGIRKSAVEKELIARTARPTVLDVVASARK